MLTFSAQLRKHKLKKLFSLAVCSCLSAGCAALQRPETPEQAYPYRDLSHVLQRIRETFPEALDAYFSVQYQAGQVQDHTYLQIAQIRFYWPARLSPEPVFERYKALMREFQPGQPECLSIETGQDVQFTGIEEPLHALILDAACG